MDLILSAPIGALLIFLLRMTDVSMAMVRMIMAVRGYRKTAAVIGFFEVMVWLAAVGTALEHLDSPLHVIGYAGGFAAGNYVGVWLEEQLALGHNVVRATFNNREGIGSGGEAARLLREEGFAVTEITGRGLESPVDILNVVVLRRQVPHVTRLLHTLNPNAFISVEDVRDTFGGYVRPAGRKLPFLTRA